MNKLFYKLITRYDFSEVGNIRHSFGNITIEPPSNTSVWEHTSVRHDSGAGTCYGPYTKEIDEKGDYKAVFRIKACGIKNRNVVILTIDIAHGKANGPMGDLLKQKRIRGEEFKDGDYNNFILNFKYTDQSFLEFRCIVHNPENYKIMSIGCYLIMLKFIKGGLSQVGLKQ